MNEILLTSKEISVLDNDADLESLSLTGKITKEQLVQTTSKSQREKLKNLLSTNKDLQTLLAEAEVSARNQESQTRDKESSQESAQDKVAAAKPEDPALEADKIQEPATIEEEKTTRSTEKKSPIEVEKEYRSLGRSDLFVLFRMLERGYMPTIHDSKFMTGNFKGNKLNWIKHNGIYGLKGGPITNGYLNGKLSSANVWTDKKVREMIFEDIRFEKAQARELLHGLSKNKVKIDVASIDTRIKSLEELENALHARPINNAAIQRAKNDYMAISDKSFETIAKNAKIKLSTANSAEQKVKLEKQLQNKNSQFSNETKRLSDFNSHGGDPKQLGAKASRLDRGDLITINGKTNAGDQIKLNVLKKNANGTLEVESMEFQTKGSVVKRGKEIVRIDKNGNVIDAHTGNVRYEGKSFDVKSRKYGVLEKEIKRFEARKAKNLEIEAELAKKRPNLTKVEKLRKEYEVLSTGKTRPQIGERVIVKQEIAEVSRVKKELKEIEDRIEGLKKQASDELKKLDKQAGKDPSKIEASRQEGKRIVEETNKEIIKLNQKGVSKAKELDYDQLMKLSKESKVAGKIKTADAWIDGVLHSKGGKVVTGIAVLTLIAGAAGGAMEIKNQGLTKETALDIFDLGAGFIPTAGGVYDLIIAARGKDLNDRVLTRGDRMVRTGFGIVGLIPGAGLLLKSGAKIAKGATGVRLVRGADAILEGTRVAGKIGVYGYLGYSLKESTIKVVHNLKS